MVGGRWVMRGGRPSVMGIVSGVSIEEEEVPEVLQRGKMGMDRGAAGAGGGMVVVGEQEDLVHRCLRGIGDEASGRRGMGGEEEGGEWWEGVFFNLLGNWTMVMMMMMLTTMMKMMMMD